MNLYRKRGRRAGPPPDVAGTVRVETDDGSSIAVECIAADGKYDQAVVVTHGTFSDRRSCLGLARHVAKAGFACCSFEWRGHGLSGPGTRDATFEDIAQYDVPAALEAVRASTGRKRVLWTLRKPHA